MAGDNHGLVFAEGADELADFHNLPRVQSHGRLVQNQHVRVAEHRLRNADALAVSLGKAPAQLVLHRNQRGRLHDLAHLAHRFLVRNALCLCDKQKIFLRGHVREQGRDFGQVADLAFDGDRVVQHILAVDHHRALGRGKTAGYDVHRGGFSRTVRSEQAVDFPRPDGKADAAQCKVRTVLLGQVFYFNQENFLRFAFFASGRGILVPTLPHHHLL